ncbi:Hsp70 family protein [Aggregicoccus sp. 17bor-14]|uniref:hsp70 family protein n=1 Tax=Myxococcaceae TaxID=31 RepID=UPI00129D090F|nr:MULTISPECIES: hsp70 family protein [Myxococcaceae]MBF5042709.1 Hsp70 family protein [Simulacricoccus sp. 17bor-14]MRI88477.1 Hsp70 family protein [Aggregicoccus sp. 17bor-14]
MHIVGIDLGTTHCAVAAVDPSRGGASAPVQDFPVQQLVGLGEVAPRKLLPSTLYVPAGSELAPESLRLPWGEEVPVVGEFARWQGARVPGRLVASAKSWLCHPGVDRSAPILPWGAGADVAKLSPVEASALLLRHMARAWDAAHPDAPLAQQEVVITVPASFDEAARALTVSAARRAGLERFTLLEEPQAAFYDFTARHRADLAQALAGVRLVLVVDVGGGTTDFTLVHAGVSPEGPILRRLAVGEHLMLGGDNMDAALARRVEEKLSAGGRRLGATQWTQALQAARVAKESLLGEAPPERYGVSLVAGGSRLLGGSLSTELTREEVEQLVLDGFLPRSAPDERPRRAARMALQELGLPYAQDAAITRHLAAFLQQHAEAGHAALGEPHAPGALPRPDAVLLNGGVFNSPAITERLLDAVSAWWPGAPRIPLLRHESLELAVARGAAYYGLVRRGLGLRIGGGAARAYYVRLEAAPGSGDTQPQALCLIPRGFEEGQSVELGQQPFTLALGRPVQFALLSTTSDRIDKPGDVVALAEDLKPLPPIHTLLKGASGKAAEVPVHLQAALTEIGTLELSCVSDVADERWRLEFELRGQAGTHELTVTESMPARFAEAKEDIERVYGSKPLPVGLKDVKQLTRTLEGVLGPREGWRVPVLRELWSSLYAGASKRRRSADHERVFFSLLGYTLRPGFGYPLDAWRAEQTFSLFEPLVNAHAEKAVWIEFWVMWRRIAGGLSEAQHARLYAYLEPHLARRVPPELKPQKNAPKPKGVQPEGLDEMVRLAASLEHLEAAQKEQLGGHVAARLRAEARSGGPWAWALGRLGARVPLYGSGHKVVGVEAAEAWLALLLELGLGRIDGAAFAAAQLARLTGDRTRDLDPALRERTRAALVEAKAAEGWVRMVTEVVELAAADEARALGDTLPAGLRLGA